jgi:ATP phosphoribosyltransferase regulatory subunit
MEQNFANLVEKWGYQEVVTPTYEYFENLTSGPTDDDKLLKFLDRKGHLMAMRPDMTRSIARLVSTRMRNVTFPLRLYYLSHAFNYEEPLVGRQRESYQAGVEILGAAGPAADAEAIALVVEAMQTCGLQDFRLSLGHVGLFHSLMKEFQLPEEQVEAIKNAVGSKDFVKLSELLVATDLSPEDQKRLTRLMSLRGGTEVLDQAAQLMDNKETIAALDNLKQVYDTLTSYGVQDKVAIDLGLLLKLDYYTGVVFEGYTLSLGFPICGGGRYDHLLGHFGSNLPATGFALSIDQLLVANEKQQGPAELDNVDVLVTWQQGYLPQAVKKAQTLRAKGLKVELALSATTPEQVSNVKSSGVAQVIFINSED